LQQKRKLANLQNSFKIPLFCKQMFSNSIADSCGRGVFKKLLNMVRKIVKNIEIGRKDKFFT
jgi:hypothetical protein